MSPSSLGALLHAFLADELPLQKGLRPASIKAYRDGLRLFLTFVAADVPCRLTQITLDALTLERVLRFLQHLEDSRHNHRLPTQIFQHHPGIVDRTSVNKAVIRQ